MALTREQRVFLLERVPWVTHLQKPTACSSPTRKGHMCTKKAQWSYRYLRGQLTGVVSKRMCLDHLMWDGFHIDPSESARIEKWLVKHPEVLEAARKLKS